MVFQVFYLPIGAENGVKTKSAVGSKEVCQNIKLGHGNITTSRVNTGEAMDGNQVLLVLWLNGVENGRAELEVVTQIHGDHGSSREHHCVDIVL